MQLLLQRCYCCHKVNPSQLFAGLALAAGINRFPVDVPGLNLLDFKLLLLVLIHEKTNTAVEKYHFRLRAYRRNLEPVIYQHQEKCNSSYLITEACKVCGKGLTEPGVRVQIHCEN